MERRPIAYDITRLVTRVLSQTPNGIDRIDFAFADYFLGSDNPRRTGVMMTPFGPRMLSPQSAREAIDNIRKHWGEDASPDNDEHYREVVSAIDDVVAPAPRVSKGRKGQYGDLMRWIGRHGFPIGRSPREFLAEGGAYINVSQFLLEMDRYYSWLDLESPRDGVFFIHDLLPLEMPEYFRPAELPRHAKRMKTLAKRGRAAIVSTEVMRESLAARMALLGRPNFPIHVAPLPPDPIFAVAEKMGVSPRHPYFVMCGTIEPRKNHLLMLHVWRELVSEMGRSAPKLVLIGYRGWENEHILDLLDRCPGLQDHVIETSGLPTPSVKHLILGARALLMPSFAEGYGLPVVEALSAGVPVIASDIPVFRSIGGAHVKTIGPLDGLGWRNAILEFIEPNSVVRQTYVDRLASYAAPAWPDFFIRLEGFLEKECRRPTQSFTR